MRRVTNEIALIIENVRTFFELERHQDQRIAVARVIERTAAATGYSIQSIMRIRNQGAHLFPSISEKEERKRESELDEEDLLRIRTTILDMYAAT